MEKNNIASSTCIVPNIQYQHTVSLFGISDGQNQQNEQVANKLRQIVEKKVDLAQFLRRDWKRDNAEEKSASILEKFEWGQSIQIMHTFLAFLSSTKVFVTKIAKEILAMSDVFIHFYFAFPWYSMRWPRSTSRHFMQSQGNSIHLSNTITDSEKTLSWVWKETKINKITMESNKVQRIRIEIGNWRLETYNQS